MPQGFASLLEGLPKDQKVAGIFDGLAGVDNSEEYGNCPQKTRLSEVRRQRKEDSRVQAPQQHPADPRPLAHPVPATPPTNRSFRLLHRQCVPPCLAATFPDHPQVELATPLVVWRTCARHADRLFWVRGRTLCSERVEQPTSRWFISN
jgi:hypothetical protein